MQIIPSHQETDGVDAARGSGSESGTLVGANGLPSSFFNTFSIFDITPNTGSGQANTPAEGQQLVENTGRDVSTPLDGDQQVWASVSFTLSRTHRFTESRRLHSAGAHDFRAHARESGAEA